MLRHCVVVGVGAVLLLGLTACSGTRDDQTDQSGANKRTIKHKFGETTITGTPKRVVSVGLSEHDTLLALGVKPVALIDWYGDQPNGVWPWARAALGDAKPVAMSQDALNFEQIAALKPDLITGVSSLIDEKEYRRLSQIAPTVAQDGTYQNLGTPWEEQTMTLGRAVGREDKARQLTEELTLRFETTRKENPQFEGKQALVALASGPTSAYKPWLYSPESLRSRFMADLGFTILPEASELTGNAFSAELSRERLDVLNRADVLLWVSDGDGLDGLRSDRAYQALRVAKEKRDVLLDDKIATGALSYGNVLSLRYALDKITPQLQRAVRGTT